MHILLSNDDGYQAPGINTLREHLLQAGHQVTLIAPDRNRSACSSLLTVNDSLLPVEVEEGLWYVKNGTPADCIHLALGGLFDFTPDMICAGINDCANLGDDTIYSGTVAAVIEGRHTNCPKIAFSLDSGESNSSKKELDFTVPAEIAVQIIKTMQHRKDNAILNVNIPALPHNQIQGWQITRLGARVKSSPITAEINDDGQTVYFVGDIGRCKDNHSGTDFEALEKGFVSITPIREDLTDYSALPNLTHFLAMMTQLKR
jgi:5'-nucleotidase